MGDVLNRNLGTVDALQPGEFTTVGCGEFVEARAILRCPKCGGIDALTDDYAIQRDGRVVPAWRCPTETCGAVLWISLESWS